MLSTLFAASALAMTPPVIVEGSRGWRSDRHVVTRALRAPLRPRATGQVHYCFEKAVMRSDGVRRVCRTRRDWNRLGLDQVAG